MPLEHPVPLHGRYVAAMQRAVAFTREIGCTTRTGFDPAPAFINPEISEVILEWARLNICSRDDDGIAGRCMHITSEFVSFLRGAGLDAIFTLGWMSYHDEHVYHFGPDDVRRWLAHGIADRKNMNVHAWATLASAEIVDPSWLSTVGIVQNKRHLIGAMIIADPAQVTRHQYHPVAVDTDVLYRIGLLDAEFRQSPLQLPPSDRVLSLAG